jgi:hypothetical protein
MQIHQNPFKRNWQNCLKIKILMDFLSCLNKGRQCLNNWGDLTFTELPPKQSWSQPAEVFFPGLEQYSTSRRKSHKIFICLSLLDAILA